MKRKGSFHIIIIQKLFTTIWLRQLNKIADCLFFVPPIHSFWRRNNYENLAIAFVFPFLPFRPWQLQGTPKMFSMGRGLCRVFKEEDVNSWDILCKFLLECSRLPTLSPDVVWGMLYYRNKPPFSCELASDTWRESRKRKRSKGSQGKITRSMEGKIKGSN